MNGDFWFAVYALMNVTIVVLLAMNVSRLRMRENVPHGDGDNLEVKKAIRAHGNGVENVAIFGLLVLAMAMLEVAPALLGALVVAFTLARLLHAAGMLGPVMSARRIGAGVTYLCEVVGAAAVLVALLGAG